MIRSSDKMHNQEGHELSFAFVGLWMVLDQKKPLTLQNTGISQSSTILFQKC